MRQIRMIPLADIAGDLRIYFNWSANVLMPVNSGAADIYLKENKSTILKVAQTLLKEINYIPSSVYRGILLQEPVNVIMPHEGLEYLSFSTDRAVAEHFSDTEGFGSEIMNLAIRLGTYGYVIEYTPSITEILFHYSFLSLLPYAEAFTIYGIDGQVEVEGLRKQKEITILQPIEPFTNITKKFA